MVERRERDVQKRFAITVSNEEQALYSRKARVLTQPAQWLRWQMRRIREEEERVRKEDEERRRVQHAAKRAMDRERVRLAALGQAPMRSLLS